MNFDLSLNEVYDMSWVEFVTRSIGFKKKRKYEAFMVRVIAYQSFCSQYIFSKKKPPSIDKFWKIEEEKSKSTITESQKEAFNKAFAKYQKEVNG